MTTTSICIIAAMVIVPLLAESNYRTIRGYIIFDRIDIHCEIQAVPFAQLSRMQPGEPSAVIRERVIKAHTIADLAGSEKVKSMHIAEAIGYRNLDRGGLGRERWMIAISFACIPQVSYPSRF